MTDAGSSRTGRDHRLRVLRGVQDGSISARSAATALRGLHEVASGSIPDPAPELGWVAPSWVPAPTAPATTGRSPAVVVIGTGTPPAEMPSGAVYMAHRGVHGAGRAELDLSDSAGCVAAVRLLPTEVDQRAVVVLDSDDMPGDGGPSRVAGLVRAVLEDPSRLPTRLVWVVTGAHAAERAAAVGAYGQIVHLEEPGLSVVAVGLPDVTNPAEAVRIGVLETRLPWPATAEVRYQAGQRTVRDLTTVTPGPDACGQLVELGSTCLITGGTGGLAAILATELARRYRARLILLGRRARDADTDQLCQRLSVDGAEALYLPADVTDSSAVTAAVEDGVRRWGPVHHVFHLAGTSTGRLARTIDQDQVDGDWSAKVVGARHLDEATRDQPLRSFVVFSSASAYLGAPGQAAYAAASRAVGELAVARDAEVRAGHRSGATRSVVWPMWADGGLELDDWGREHLRTVTGQLPLPVTQGIAALEVAIAAPWIELGPVFGDLDRFRPFLAEHLRMATVPGDGSPSTVVGRDGAATADRGHAGPADEAVGWLAGLVEQTARFPAGTLDVDADFTSLGVDSLLIRRLGVAMESRLGPQPTSQFYDHRTVRELAAHLEELHPGEFGDRAPARVAERPVPQDRAPDGDQDIAIIGMSGRFPGAADPDELWTHLLAGTDLVTEVPVDRWDPDEYFSERPGTPGRTNGRWGGFLDGVADFDPLFFGISPREAELIDPQERLFLEAAWNALEDAACSPDLLHRLSAVDGENRVGVFAGVTSGQYQLFGIEQWAEGRRSSPTSSYWAVANRVSYVLGLHGPSMSIDTACSSSLVAIHQACESIRRGESLVAIAGGVNVSLHPAKYVALAQHRFLSTDGRCRAFGADGDGYVPGEGVGVLVLKPLTAARRDGDPVRAVIKSTAVNHGGRTQGFTVPGPRAQSAVVSRALRAGGVAPGSVSYVEAHGTGTALGDPIEIEGLERAFGAGLAPGSCAIGSVKSNIGHLEAAAGVAGVMKCVLQMHHRTLVPTLHADPLNPVIRWDGSVFRPQQVAEPWLPDTDSPLRAMVSSFGAGGTNANLVLEAAEEHLETGAPPSGQDEVVLLSARTEPELRRCAARLRDALWSDVPPLLGDVAWTLAVGRDALQIRAALRASTLEELGGQLDRLVRGDRSDLDWADEIDDPRADAARAWSRGERVAWEELVGDRAGRRRVRLPGYPFTRERYWLAGAPAAAERAGPAAGGRSSSATSGPVVVVTDPVVDQHRVQGRAVLPGVAHVLAALHAAGPGTRALERVEWRRAVVAPSTGSISLTVAMDDAGTFAISSAGDAVPVTHSVGYVVPPADLPAPEAVDLAELRARCTEPLDPRQIYLEAQRDGLDFGPAFQGMVSAARSVDGREVLATVNLSWRPPGSGSDRLWWCAVPALDSVLHPLLALGTEGAGALVPQSLDRIDLIRVPRSEAIVHARVRSSSASTSGAVCDVTVVDPDGAVCVVVQGLLAVELARTPGGDHPPQARPGLARTPGDEVDIPLVPCLVPRWQVVSPGPTGVKAGRGVVIEVADDLGLGARLLDLHAAGVRRVVADHDLPEIDELAALLTDLSGGDCVYLLTGLCRRRYSADDPEHAEQVQRRTVLVLMRVCQALGDLPGRGRGVRVVVLTNDVQQVDDEVAWNPFSAGLTGFAHVAAAELPGATFVSLDLRLADVLTADDVDRIGSLAHALDPVESGDEYALRAGVLVRRVHEAAALPMTVTPADAFGTAGTHLVIGGAGGLGLVVAEMLSTRCAAQVYLVGRRSEAALDAAVAARIAADPRLHYLEGDVTDEADAQRVVRIASGPQRRLAGVIHAAFVLGDGVIARATEEDLARILAPKVAGSVGLVRALTDVEVRRTVFFSSAIAFTGARGQSCYAAASSFQDAFARFVASRWGHDVTVFDWGFWGETGAVATDDYRGRMADRGVIGLTTDEGLAALTAGVGAGLRQVAPIRAEGVEPARALSRSREDSVVQRVHADLRQVQARTDPLEDDAALEALEEVAHRALVERTDLLGLAETGERPDQVEARLGVRPERRPLLEGILDILVRRGYVRRGAGGALVPTDLGRAVRTGPAAADRELSELRARHPETGGFLVLVDRCTTALLDVLRGDTFGNEVLFPHGSDELVAAVYRGSRRSDHFNSLVLRAVESAATHTGRAIRVLEIGAGTGATTDRIIAGMGEGLAQVARYDVTDISPSLVRAATHKYEGSPVPVRTGVFDVERPPRGQGYDEGSYDVVVATNVLHATRRIPTTLTHATDLLRPGGLLVVNEVTRVRDFVTVVFGLAEGWWLAEDREIRIPHSPLLRAGAWRAVAHTAGLEHARTYGDPSGGDDQVVLVAERGPWLRSTDGATVDAAPRSGLQPAAPSPSAVPTSPGPVPERTTTAQEALVALLADVYADVLRIRGERIDPLQPLSSYGCDSVASLEVLDRLEADLGHLPSRLVLGAQNIDALATALMAEIPAAAAPPTAAPGTAIASDDVPVPVPEPEPAPAPREPEVATDAHDRSAISERDAAGAPIAIVGMAGRYPGAVQLDQWWRNLLDGRRAIGPVPADRWPAGAAGEDAGTRWGGFLDSVDEFDSLLFGVSPREAAVMDPQTRLFLQSVWELLENAGYPRSRANAVARSARAAGVGVFVGAMYAPYELLAAERWALGDRVAAHSGSWNIANRVSFAYGFDGPSLAVDTACSSSATAIHLACESLRRGESGMAVAGGVNLILHPGHHFGLAQAGLLSGTGRPRPFSPDADGMVTAEGVGALLLRPLEDALRDGDQILGCILGSTLGSSGPRDHYAAPDSAGQQAQMNATLRAAGVCAEDVGHVEAQALGSALGDAAEVTALRAVLETGRRSGHGCSVGTLKSTVGHLEAASGVAQVTKVLLQFRHGMITPAVGADDPFRRAGSSTVHVALEPERWTGPGAGGRRRIALVDSLGAGGANTHLVLAEPPPRAPRPRAAGKGRALPFLLSARRPAQLREVAQQLVDAVDPASTVLEPQDVARTLWVGREPLGYRLAVVADDLAGLVARLQQWLDHPDGEPPVGVLVQDAVDAPATTPAEQAATRWVRGMLPDWEELGVDDARTVALPTYPFARERHWLPVAEEAREDVAARAPDPVPAPGAVPVGTTVVPALVPHPRQSGLDLSARSLAVRSALADVLAVDLEAIDERDSISDFGLDSVSVVALAETLRTRNSAAIVASDLYGLRTVGDLVDRVAPTDAAPVSLTPAVLPGPGTPDLRPAAAEVGDTVDAADAVAIIGMAVRFPGADDPAAYWRATLAGRVETRPLPADRGGSHPEDPDGPGPHLGTFVDGIDEFDPAFFGISPREARLMDPQHRLFLTTVWHAIEDAGYDPGRLAASATGVFAGVAGTEYGHLLRQQSAENDGQLVTGNVHSVLANRVSYLLDLRGPSEPVDTACSSSLVAVHRAVHALRSGECTLAVAGGVNVLLTEAGFEAFGASGMLAPDGRCKTFDSRADGYVRGEGVGAVLLKPLAQARADGDHIHAVIRGTAVGHGGRAASLTAPQPEAQADVITRAWSEAGGEHGPQFLEVHGTGTQLGDPVEVAGLVRAAERLRDVGVTIDRCGLSTGKTGIGHLETAAGIAGLVRAVLALQHRILPPLAGFSRPNDLIDLAASPFSLVTSPRAWETPRGADGTARARRAGVSSFGFGGVNAHVALDEAPDRAPAGPATLSPADQVAVLSARGDSALQRSVEALADALDPMVSDRPVALADVAFTLQVGRTEFGHRVAVVATDVPDLVRQLRALIDGREPETVHTGIVDGIAGPDRTAPTGEAGTLAAQTADELARRWVRGDSLDWAASRSGGVHRLSLPGYPFARERFWWDTVGEGAPGVTRRPARADRAPVGSARTDLPGAARHEVPDLPEDSTTMPLQISVTSPVGGREVHVRRFRQILSEHLEIPAEAIGETEDLRGIGVDSIAALRVMQTVHEEYGDQIPMLAIIEHPSVERFVDQVLMPSTGTAPTASTTVVEDTGEGSGERLGESPVEESDAPSSGSAPVYHLADGRDPDSVPLFCLPGITGELTWALALLRDAPGRMTTGGQVLGVESSAFGAAASTKAPRDIGASADECVHAILEQAPGRPVRLMAHGTMVVLGLEVARRLLEAQVPVDDLVLVRPPRADAWRPEVLAEGDNAAVAVELGWAWDVCAEVRSALAGPPEERGDSLVDALAAGASGMTRAEVREWLERSSRCHTGLMAALRAWDLAPLVGAPRVSVWGESTGWDRLVVPPPVEEPDPGPPGTDPAPHARMIEVVPVNRGGDQPASFWCHSLLGDVSYALNLSRHLGVAYPVFGLEQFDREGGVRVFDRVEDLAAAHVAAMRRTDPVGPYTLGGYSMGGIVAYETARQLLAAGAEIRHLTLVDPIMPGTPAWNAVETENIAGYEFSLVSLVLIANAFGDRWKVERSISHEQLADKDVDERVREVARHLHAETAGRRDIDHIAGLVQANHEVIDRNNAALERYRPVPLAQTVPTVLLRASQGHVGPDNPNGMPVVGRLQDDPSNGFAPFVGAGLTLVDVDADHFTICDGRHIPEVSELVRRAWGEL